MKAINKLTFFLAAFLPLVLAAYYMMIGNYDMAVIYLVIELIAIVMLEAIIAVYLKILSLEVRIRGR